MVLFVQATFNASAGYVPVYTVFLFTHTYLTSYLSSFALGWITPAIQSLQERVASCLEIICRSISLAAIFYYFIIKITSSDAESHEI